MEGLTDIIFAKGYVPGVRGASAGLFLYVCMASAFGLAILWHHHGSGRRPWGSSGNKWAWTVFAILLQLPLLFVVPLGFVYGRFATYGTGRLILALSTFPVFLWAFAAAARR